MTSDDYILDCGQKQQQVVMVVDDRRRQRPSALLHNIPPAASWETGRIFLKDQEDDEEQQPTTVHKLYLYDIAIRQKSAQHASRALSYLSMACQFLRNHLFYNINTHTQCPYSIVIRKQ